MLECNILSSPSRDILQRFLLPLQLFRTHAVLQSLRSLATVGAIIVSGNIVGVVGDQEMSVLGGLRLPQGRYSLVELSWEVGIRHVGKTYIVRFLGGESEARKAGAHTGRYRGRKAESPAGGVCSSTSEELGPFRPWSCASRQRVAPRTWPG